MKFYIETYGCQMNVADSELISSILIASDIQQCQSIDEADVIIFNTCSVRQHAEDRVLGRISNERKRKAAKPWLKIGVVGCMAQRIGDELVSKGNKLDFAVGVDQYSMLPQIIENGMHSDALAFNGEEVYENLHPTHGSKTNGFVTIMRGCNNFCTYCIVPHVRGRERSRPFDEIYQDVAEAGKLGLKDITLLGQNVNSYMYDGMGFAELLERLNQIEDIYRLRFITSHPKDLSDELIAVMARCNKVCNHIHLPMQSGSTEILKRMNRNYSFEHYRSLIDKLRTAIPDIAITTDIIAGFPYEDDQAFEATLNAVREIEFDYAFCFKYSPREGTEAASYPSQVPEAIRLARLQELIDVQREITKKKFQAQIGKACEVYIESISKKSSEQISGSTRDFKVAVLDGSSDQIGSLVKAVVIDATAGTLICKPLDR